MVIYNKILVLNCYIFILESPPVKKRKVTFCHTPAIISDNKSFNVESSDEAIVDVETVKDEDNPPIREGDALTLPTQGLVSLIADNVSEGQIRLRKATDCVAEGIDTSATDIWRKRNPRKKRGQLMISPSCDSFFLHNDIMCLSVINYLSIQSNIIHTLSLFIHFILIHTSIHL